MRSRSALALSCLALAACASTLGPALLDGAFSAIKKTFLGVATENYGDGYREDFDKVLSALTDVAKDRVQGQAEEETSSGEPAADTSASSSASSGSESTAGSSGSGSAGGASAEPALALEFALLKEVVVDGRSVPTPVADGETIYDRFGANGEGDNLKLSFRAAGECWVYVLSIDSTGWMRPLFPSSYSGETNPVKPHTTYEVPPGNVWATLDSYRGVEHVYLVASRTQRTELEAALTQFAARVRDVDSRRVLESRPKVELVADAARLSRGWDTARPSRIEGVTNSSGASFAVDTQLFAARGAGELVLTRWFKHE